MNNIVWVKYYIIFGKTLLKNCYAMPQTIFTMKDVINKDENNIRPIVSQFLFH